MSHRPSPATTAGKSIGPWRDLANPDVAAGMPRRAALHQGQAIGRSCGGMMTRIKALADTRARLMGFRLLPGQAQDLRGTAALIEGLGCGPLLADRVCVGLAGKGIEAVIRPTSSRRCPAGAAPGRDPHCKAQGRHGHRHAFRQARRQLRGLERPRRDSGSPERDVTTPPQHVAQRWEPVLRSSNRRLQRVRGRRRNSDGRDAHQRRRAAGRGRVATATGCRGDTDHFLRRCSSRRGRISTKLQGRWR